MSRTSLRVAPSREKKVGKEKEKEGGAPFRFPFLRSCQVNSLLAGHKERYFGDVSRFTSLLRPVLFVPEKRPYIFLRKHRLCGHPVNTANDHNLKSQLALSSIILIRNDFNVNKATRTRCMFISPLLVLYVLIKISAF